MLDKTKGKRIFEVSGLHHDLYGKLYKNKTDIDLHIIHVCDHTCGCKKILVKYKNSDYEDKTCFPDVASREQVIKWIAESLSNKTDIIPSQRDGMFKIKGYAYINGHKIEIITIASKNIFGSFKIKTSYPKF